MRHTIGYVLSRTQAVIEFDQVEFDKVLEGRSEYYEYIQTFDDNNIIEYNTLVLNCKTTAQKMRVETVSEVYKLYAQESRTRGDEIDYIFYLPKPIMKGGATRLSKILESLYGANTRYFTFYNPDTTEKVMDGTLNIPLLQDIGVWIDNSEKLPINDVRNIDALTEAQTMPPDLVLERLRKYEKVDGNLGIIIGYGGVLDYVLAQMRSIEATYRFFTEHFGIEFNDASDSMEEFLDEGVGVMADGIILAGNSMRILDDKGNSRELTDFRIAVHYKIQRKSGTSYIVSLIKDDSEIKHVEWPMSFSEMKISEFVSGFGAYHIVATKGNIKKIHEMISSARVPDITVYYRYGKTRYNDENIIIFKDYIYNVTKNVAIPKLTGSEFYFVDGINGIMVEGKDGTSIDTMLVDKAPSMGTLMSHEFNVFHDTVKEVFTDTAGDLLIMNACTWLGHMLFPTEYSCPLFFTTGITGSGKTTYAKYLCSMFGIKKPLSIEGTTPFPLRISLTLLNQLPLFLNEFRTKMPGAHEKTSIIKSLFDGTAFERGKKDLTIESHTFSSYIFMEGEELPESGAARSRSIIWKIKKTGQGRVSAENVLADNRELFSSFIYSYFKGASRDAYYEALEEGFELFDRKGMDKRILTNITLLYAGTVAFAQHKKEYFRKVCQDLIDVQLADYEQNGTVAEIINILGKYLGNRYAKVYTDGYDAIIPWNDVVDFCDRARITTELKLNNYRDHVESFGIQTGYMTIHNDDVFNKGEMMVDGLRIGMRNIDKRFLCNAKVYELYKSFNAKAV